MANEWLIVVAIKSPLSIQKRKIDRQIKVKSIPVFELAITNARYDNYDSTVNDRDERLKNILAINYLGGNRCRANQDSSRISLFFLIIIRQLA